MLALVLKDLGVLVLVILGEVVVLESPLIDHLSHLGGLHFRHGQRVIRGEADNAAEPIGSLGPEEPISFVDLSN